jgi:hypothetical protein
MFRRLVILLLALMLTLPLGVTAQQPPAIDLFPPAEALGDGWSLVSAADANTNQWPPFERFTAAIYLGPEGGRVLVGRILAGKAVSNASDSWTLASAMFDTYETRFTPDPVSETRLAGTSPVSGCASMRRTDGYDAVIPGIPVGLSLCAAQPVIIMAYASGEVTGVSGHTASDRVVELVLSLEAEN